MPTPIVRVMRVGQAVPEKPVVVLDVHVMGLEPDAGCVDRLAMRDSTLPAGLAEPVEGRCSTLSA